MEDERGPGLDFSLCFVCGSRPWGAAALLLCLFIFIKLVLNVRRFPPPSSRSTNFVTVNISSEIFQLYYKIKWLFFLISAILNF